MKLILFDIDRTLIKSAQAKDTIAYPTAFQKVYGIKATIDPAKVQGLTDPQIIINTMKAKGLDETVIRSKINECMQEMIATFNRVVDDDQIVVLNGIPELLAELQRRKVLLGLVTGNLEPIARATLKKVNLETYFPIGGFGSDHIDRSVLVQIAIRRAQERCNFPKDGVVIHCGDAPQDMLAGKKAGIRTIGVTTGIYSREQLQQAGADSIINNWEDTQTVIALMGV